MQPSEILLYSLMGIFFVLGIVKLVSDINSVKDIKHQNDYYLEAKVDPRYPVVAQETVKPSTSSDSFLGTLEKPERIKSSSAKKTTTKRKPTKEKSISKEGDKGNDLLLS